LFVASLERMYEGVRDQQRDLSVRASDPLLAMEQLIEHTFSALESNPNAIRLMNEENKHRGKYYAQVEADQGSLQSAGRDHQLHP
jgi:TetR/AcrR family transcriptional regulator